MVPPSLSPPVADVALPEVGRALLANEFGPMAIAEPHTGRIVGMNATCARLFGFESTNLHGGTLNDSAIHRNSEALGRLATAIEHAGQVRDLELGFCQRDGSALELLCSGESIELSGRRYLHVQFQKGTKARLNREIESKLARKQRLELLGTFCCGVAHDFNNLLATMILNLDLVSREASEGKTVEGRLSDLRKATGRASELARHILAFGREEQPERQPIQLQPLVAQVLRMFRPGLSRTVAVDAQIDPLVPEVLANGCQIQQVFLNLLLNASHAMQGGSGTLSVRFARAELEKPAFKGFPGVKSGSYARLTVTDTGCGMSPEVVARIFSPFFTTKESGGSGLGLAMARHIVNSHEGAITVDSTPGAGATFTVYLPTLSAD